MFDAAVVELAVSLEAIVKPCKQRYALSIGPEKKTLAILQCTL